MTRQLPSWALEKDGQVLVDVDLAYPAYLAALQLQPTQFAVGVVKQCVMRDLADLGVRTIRLTGSKVKWRDENLPGEAGDHDRGLRQAGPYRDRLIRKRAASALTGI